MIDIDDSTTKITYDIQTDEIVVDGNIKSVEVYYLSLIENNIKPEFITHRAFEESKIMEQLTSIRIPNCFDPDLYQYIQSKKIH